MRACDVALTRHQRVIQRCRDNRLPLILAYCCTCGSIIEVRKGVMDRHKVNRRGSEFTRYGPVCPGKRWRR